MGSGQAPAAIPTSGRHSSKIAWLLCALSMVLVASAIVLAVLNDIRIGSMIFFVSVMSCAVVGGMVASR